MNVTKRPRKWDDDYYRAGKLIFGGLASIKEFTDMQPFNRPRTVHRVESDCPFFSHIFPDGIFLEWWDVQQAPDGGMDIPAPCYPEADRGPEDIWLKRMICSSTFATNWMSEDDQAWSYVMWDRSRLEKLGALNKDGVEPKSAIELKWMVFIVRAAKYRA